MRDFLLPNVKWFWDCLEQSSLMRGTVKEGTAHWRQARPKMKWMPWLRYEYGRLWGGTTIRR